MRLILYIIPIVIIAIVLFYFWRIAGPKIRLRFRTVTSYGEKPAGNSTIYIYRMFETSTPGKFEVTELTAESDAEGYATIVLDKTDIGRITYIKALHGEELSGQLEKDQIKAGKLNKILMSNFHLK